MAVAVVVVGVVAALASGYAAYSASEAQADAQRHQAKLAKNQAINAQNAAAVEMENRRESFKRQMAAQRALMGASGVQLGEGSTLLVEVDAGEQAALDLARVRYAGEVRSTTYQDESRLMRWQSGVTRTQGRVSTGASLLSSGAQVGGYAYANRSRGGGDGVAEDA